MSLDQGRGGGSVTYGAASPPSPTTQWEPSHTIGVQAATLRVADSTVTGGPPPRPADGRVLLDLRGLLPRGPVQPGEWRHRVRCLDGKGRVAVPEVAVLGVGVGGALHAGIVGEVWELRPIADGSPGIAVDARLRVLVPIGVRHQLGLEADVVVSVAVDGSRVVVWRACRLDALVVQS